MIYTNANGHLGDAVWHAIILRKIGGHHTFYVPQPYMRCINECLEGTDIEVKDMAGAPADALSAWIACGRFESHGVRYQHQTDIVHYLLQWANAIGRECGEPRTLFQQRQDMLCRFPAIQRDIEAPEFDVLVVNAQPLSGQCPQFDNREMNTLIVMLAEKHKVLCTNTVEVDAPVIDTSICGIGNLANRAKLVVAVSTGASACIHNKFAETRTMLLLAPIVLDYARSNMSHFNNCREVEIALRLEGWL
jgi:hypothetical protein